MQIGDLDETAPIAAVKRIGAEEVQRPGNRPLLRVIGDEQNDPLRHMLADQVERFAREVRMPPFARAGILIEEPHRVPMFGADRIAGQFFDAQSLDRKSTRLTPVTNAHLVCRLLLEKKKKQDTTTALHMESEDRVRQ